MLDIALILVVLHGVDGREIDVSVAEITSVYCKIPNDKNKLLTEGANAVVNLTDGKHISVKETCSEIRAGIEEKTK